MSARWIALAALSVASAAALSCWSARCERDCAAAEREARRLLEQDELLPALARIDEVDARCRCARFTSGDAPPEYSLAVACLRRLHAAGRTAEVEDVLARARGPILRELARVWADPSRRGALTPGAQPRGSRTVAP